VVTADGGRPVEGAEVVLGASALRASTDVSGRFRLTNVAAGVRTLVVRALGLLPDTLVIRGITSDAGTSFVEPRVSVFQDGVSISKSGGSVVGLFDLELVEVLKGPPGTLFGRVAAIYNQRDGFIENAAGGTLNGKNTAPFHASLRWLPSLTSTVDLIANFQHHDSAGTSA